MSPNTQAILLQDFDGNAQNITDFNHAVQSEPQGPMEQSTAINLPPMSTTDTSLLERSPRAKRMKPAEFKPHEPDMRLTTVEDIAPMSQRRCAGCLKVSHLGGETTQNIRIKFLRPNESWICNTCNCMFCHTCKDYNLFTHPLKWPTRLISNADIRAPVNFGDWKTYLTYCLNK